MLDIFELKGPHLSFQMESKMLSINKVKVEFVIALVF